MKIFIVHSGADYDRVNTLQKSIYQQTGADLLALESKTNKDETSWKKEAKEKIKIADVILYILGEQSHTSQNIDFELKKALQYKKQILLLRLNTEQPDKVNDVLFCEDKYMSSSNITNKKPLYKEVRLEELTKFIQYGYGFDISDKLDETLEPKRSADIIEQYKVYLETSEQILNRRQSTSNFYTTLNTSILGVGSTVFGIVVGLDVIKNNLMIAASIFIVISLLGLLLCCNWLSLLESYGKLNAAKIRVISEIEKRLPVNIYDTEWKVMSEKLGGNKYRPFTSLEKRIPLIFISIYVIILVMCVVSLFVV